MVALPPSAPHPIPLPSPIDSIHDITGAEKSYLKTSSIQVAKRIITEL